MNDLVVSKLDGARKLLAEAKTIQDTKKIVDLAHSAEIFARRQKLGAEAVQYATEIKLEALRQLGQMLQSTPRATGTRGQLVGRDSSGGHKTVPPESEIPSYSDLGLDKRTSKLAQDVAALPDEIFEQVKIGAARIDQAQKEMQRAARAEYRNGLAKSAQTISPSNRWAVYTGDIAAWQAPRQYDYIITDPPYPKEYLPLYDTLGQRAAEWLKPGGLLIAMSAHYYLPDIFDSLKKHLDYFWTAAYLVKGETAGVFQKKILPQWKPLVMFTKPGAQRPGLQFQDVFESPANDKDNHKWGQSVGGMYDIISKICIPGESILDPFCGAGTTGMAAIQHGCIFDGLELDEQNASISRARISESASV